MPNTKTPNIPGATVMTDTLDFVKNLWGSMGVPGMSIPGLTAPTLTVEDLDKKIGDLKAVEAWLNVNMSMLRATIQGLEVQRGTLVTLKSLGASFAAAVQQPEKLDPQLRDSPYASAFFSHANTPAPAASPAKPAEPAEPAKAAEPASAAGSDAAAAMGNPALWWNVLQEQFKQAVSSAMSPEAVASATAMATDAAARFAASVTPEPAAEPGVARAAPSDKPSNKGGDADQAGGAGTAKPRAARSAKG